MRVIAGTARGTKLAVPESNAVRPTADRAREALMSALGGFFDGERALDLCAGSGAVGIEWLSRGCAHVDFVEPSAVALRALLANLKRCRMETCSTVHEIKAHRALAALARAEAPFDYVFIDPPYGEHMHGELVAAVIERELLAAGGEIIVERSAANSEPAALPSGWRVHWQRRYGRCVLERIRAVAP